MSNNYEKASFKKLLEKLQEDSWQLELLISGFAIFGLFYAIEPVSKAYIEAIKNGEIIFVFLLELLNIFLFILIFNLMLHIILRGLWIGALGLRYVSGDINFDNLNYSKKFTKYLKRKVGSFDNYIGKLENYCSVIFAISFLLIFYVLAFAIFIGVFSIIKIYFFGNGDILKWIGKTIIIILLIGGFLTFLDLVTGGFLKKKHWFSKIYFPFYWIFSRLTLSFLYRPLIYNFLDNKFGKRISLLLIPFYVFIALMSTSAYQKSNFFGQNMSSNKHITNYLYYEDLNKESFNRIDFSIQSKVITEPYIKINAPYYGSVEDLIFEFNPNIEPKKDERGMYNGFFYAFKHGYDLGDEKNNKKRLQKDSLDIAYIKTFNAIYSLKIDSLDYKTTFVANKISREKFGFEMYLGIKHLKEGKHMLIMSKQIKKDSIGDKIVTQIPFWYFRE